APTLADRLNDELACGRGDPANEVLLEPNVALDLPDPLAQLVARKSVQELQYFPGVVLEPGDRDAGQQREGEFLGQVVDQVVERVAGREGSARSPPDLFLVELPRWGGRAFNSRLHRFSPMNPR